MSLSNGNLNQLILEINLQILIRRNIYETLVVAYCGDLKSFGVMFVRLSIYLSVPQ